MSKINGVHALLAFLVQQSQPARQGAAKLDIKQLALLLHESQQLNERLLKIEKLLTPVETITEALDPQNSLAGAEGQWPTASVVRDTINKQERHQAFGQWHAEDTSIPVSEPFTYREEIARSRQDAMDSAQILIHRYVPTSDDMERANLSTNYGATSRVSEYWRGSGERNANEEIKEGASRLMLIAIGLALILFTLFLSV